MSNNSSDIKTSWVSSREPINQLRDRIQALCAELDLVISHEGVNDIKVQRNVSMKELYTTLIKIKNQMTETPEIPTIGNIVKLFAKLKAFALPKDHVLIDSAYQLLLDLSKLIEPEKFQQFFKKNNGMLNPSQQGSIFTVMPEEEGFTDDENSDSSTNTSGNDSFETDIDSELRSEKTSITENLNQIFYQPASNKSIIHPPEPKIVVYSTIRTNLITLKAVAKEYFSRFKQDTSRQYGEGNVSRDASTVHDEFRDKFYKLCSEKNQVKTKIQTALGKDKSNLHTKLKTIQAQLVELNEDIMRKIHEIKIAINTPNETIKPVFRRN